MTDQNDDATEVHAATTAQCGGGGHDQVHATASQVTW
jgi:hypothetical protein